MNNPEEIKRLLTPIMVAQYYLGQGKVRGNKIWYKSPFRSENTASFEVDSIGFYDFGDNWRGDVIDFIERYYNTDFKTAMKILSKDFGLPEDKKISPKLEQYLKQKREEEQQMKRNLDNWYNNTLNILCEKLHKWQEMIPLLYGEALAIAYSKEQYLDYLIDIFINATEDEKVELWKSKEEFKNV